MRSATSYGIVDRKILFNRHLHRMSIREMALYLFMVLAADRDGKSYYSDRSIMEILRLSMSELTAARDGLIVAGLITHHAPNWWVKSLSSPAKAGQPLPPRPCASSRPFCDPTPIRGVVPEALRALIRALEEKS